MVNRLSSRFAARNWITSFLYERDACETNWCFAAINFFLGFFEITVFLWLLSNILPDEQIVLNVFNNFVVGFLFLPPETRNHIVLEIFGHIPVLWSVWGSYILSYSVVQVWHQPLIEVGVWILLDKRLGKNANKLFKSQRRFGSKMNLDCCYFLWNLKISCHIVCSCLPHPIQVSAIKVNYRHFLRPGVKIRFLVDADVSIPWGRGELVLFNYKVLGKWYRSRPIVFQACGHNNVKILQHTERMSVVVIQLLNPNLAKPVPDGKKGQRFSVLELYIDPDFNLFSFGTCVPFF